MPFNMFIFLFIKTGVLNVQRCKTNKISLYGKNSILGRSVVIHADKDDLGKGNYKDSLTTGHSGKRLD